MHRLWGAKESVDNGQLYHIPVGGIEAIVSDTLEDYRAIVNVTIQSGDY